MTFLNGKLDQIYGSSYAMTSSTMTASNPSLKNSMQPKAKSKVELDLLKKEMKINNDDNIAYSFKYKEKY